MTPIMKEPPCDVGHESYRNGPPGAISPPGGGPFTIGLMAQSAVPVATSPRTVTARVRTLGIAGAVLAMVGLVSWLVSWSTGMQPLSTGSSTTRAVGLPVAAESPSALGPGPTAYAWQRGGSYVVTVEIHNSASVPVTITGADATPRDWGGAVSGPTIENGSDRTLRPVRGPFRHVRIGPDAYGVVTLVYHANPRATCGVGGSSWMDSVVLHCTTLDVVHDTQAVPLGDLRPVMADRRC
jgi:hypothetical protein